MKKSLLCLLLFVAYFFVFISPVNAAEACERLRPNGVFSPTEIHSDDNGIPIIVGPTKAGIRYEVEVEVGKTILPWCATNIFSGQKEGSEGSISHSFFRGGCNDRMFESNKTFKVNLYEQEGGNRRSLPLCTSQYTVLSGCRINIEPQQIDTETRLKIITKGVPSDATHLRISSRDSVIRRITIPRQSSFILDVEPIQSAGLFTLEIMKRRGGLSGREDPTSCPARAIEVGPRGQPKDNSGGGGRNVTLSPFQPARCDTPAGPLTGLETAVGCIPIEKANEFAAWFLKWAIGIAGGIAFLLILFSGFQIMTASGNPEKLQGGREMLTAAISGLILIIFSVFLLRLIGVEILKIPGLGLGG